MAELDKQLERLGFNAKEAKTYLALLELGEGTLADLARKSRIKRTTLYDIVCSLKNKALVTTVRSGGRLLYSAEDPRTLNDRLSDQQQALQGVLPELLAITNVLPHKPKIRYYEGVEGIKEVYRDTLQYPDQELLAWMSEDAGTRFDLDFLNNIYLPTRIKKKIWVRAIVPDMPLMREFLGEDKATLRTTRAMDHDRFPLDVEINLYGERRVALMSFQEKTGLIIENGSIYRTFKSIFEQQWASLASV